MKIGITKVAKAKIGVLSGMGPLAGSDVLHKVLAYAATAYGAVEDVEYPDITLVSQGLDGFDVQATITEKTEKALLSAVAELELASPTILGIACNTAHLCFDAVAASTNAQVIHLPKEVAKRTADQPGTFLLLCSQTTKQTGLYEAALKDTHVSYYSLDPHEQDIMDQIIALVMAHKLSEAGIKLAELVDDHQGDIDGLILGCTELPLAFAANPTLHHIPHIDSNQVLAEALVDHCYAIQKTMAANEADDKIQAIQTVPVANLKVYQLLEEKMLSYTDIAGVAVKDNQEPMVLVPTNPYIAISPIDKNMQTFTGKDIYIRAQVAANLHKASQLLQQYMPGAALQVVYGYRALSIQKKLFQSVKKQFAGSHTGTDLLEAANRVVASPKNAGHPTGAAVDIQIVHKGVPLNMGTGIWEFCPDSYVFSPYISQDAWANRQLLRKVMIDAGFAPFDGEWWHFSYGDKEWAAYYKQPHALYEQLEYKVSAQ